MPSKPKVIAITSPESPELAVLKQLEGVADVVAIGQDAATLGLADDVWPSIDIMLNCGVGERAGKRSDIEAMWPKLTGLKWMHSSSAGVEKLLFPGLVESEVTLTNAKGVYSHSLAEYALTACSWFAKDLPRMRASQKRGEWDAFEVEELRGKTLGVVGYGDIGKACGTLAKAFGMTVIALRRRAQLSEEDKAEGVLKDLFPPEQLCDMVAQCDYIVMSTPFTKATHKLFDARAVAAMKPSAVFVNVGRGKCVDEDALVAALQQDKIKGAGLDVFYTEPLPAGHALYGLDNVLMSAHCADKTKEFQAQSMQFFVDNVKRYAAGEAPLNVVDKSRGY